MKTLIQPQFVILAFALVRAADLAISAAIARGIVRAVCYGVVAVLALLAVVVILFGL